MSYRSTFARLGTASAAAAVITLIAVGPASAHVTVTPSGTTAGSYQVLTFSVPHGCDGSPTTSIAIQIPESIPEVTPTRNAFYDLNLTTTKLDPPIKAEDGDEITERTSLVTYTAKTPLPADERDSLELSLQIPDQAGQTLTFPVIQKCEQGQTAWTEVPASGQSEDDLEHPAPAFNITATGSEDQSSSDTTASDGSTSDDAGDEDSDGNGLAIAGLVAGLLGLLAGGAALARSGRRS